MNILAIETATEACSASLLVDDQVITRFQLAPREHTKLILPMMEELLETADINLKDIDAIAFSRGPGAFTGLRIATGVAQGVALSINCPVIAVSTLSALALQASLHNNQAEIIISSLDARMGEVYWCCFKVQNNHILQIEKERVSKPEEMFHKILSYQKRTIIAIGIGWDACSDSLFKNGIPDNVHYLKQQYPNAEAIVKLAKLQFLEGDLVSPENAQPIYIRNKVAEKSNLKTK